MTQPDDLPRRVGSLEQQVAMIREQLAQSAADAPAARVLAAGADNDVSEVRAELRAHTGALNALRENQLSMRDEISGLRAEMHSEIGGLRAEMQSEIGGLRTELRAEMGEMRTVLRAEIDELRQETRQGFEETRRQFATVHTGLAQIVTLIEGIN